MKHIKKTKVERKRNEKKTNLRKKSEKIYGKGKANQKQATWNKQGIRSRCKETKKKKIQDNNQTGNEKETKLETEKIPKQAKKKQRD